MTCHLMTMHDNDFKRNSQIGLSLIAIGQSWKRLFRQIISEQGIIDIPVLPLSTLLQDGDEIRQNELAKRLGVDCTAVVRVLDSLEKDELVARKEDPSDRRAKLLYLTDKGRGLAEKIVQTRIDLREELLKDVAIEDIEATERLLDQIEKNIANRNKALK